MRIATLTLVTLAFAGLSQAGQILANPGFESGSLSPWVVGRTFSAGTPWAITTTGCHSGTDCAIDTGNIELVQNFTGVDVSTVTDISFWAEHTSASVTALAVDLFYTGGGDDEFVVSTSGTTWDSFDVFAHLRGSGTLIGISVFGNSAGTTLVDDFSITTSGVPEPATTGFVLTGLAGLAVAARRRRAS